MKNKKHIFFDLDNTLWDFRRNAKYALAVLYENYRMQEIHGVNFEEFHSHYHVSNESLWASIRDRKITKDELRYRRFKEAFENAGIDDEPLSHVFEKEYMETVTNYNYVVEGAEDLLQYLREKYSIHILTNGFLEISKRKVGKSIVKNYIETMTSAEEAGLLKPEPAIFYLAMEKAGATTEESVYIGDDWIADIVGAKNIGMDAIFFNPLKEDHLWYDDVPVIDKLMEAVKFV